MAYRNFVNITPADVDWERLYEFVDKCGCSHNPRSFCMDILENVGEICPFDRGLVFMLDANHKLYGYYLKNFDEKTSKVYLEYYANEQNDTNSIFQNVRENPYKPTINVRDWANEEESDFLVNYVHVQNIKYSVGFALYDLNATVRTIVALDRLHSDAFTNRELYNLQMGVNMLNHIHKNFFYRGSSLSDIKQSTWEDANLTAREIEVVDLLTQGVSPANISTILYVSQSTTYKHIAHIYSKMGVSTQQELLVKLLRKADL